MSRSNNATGSPGFADEAQRALAKVELLRMWEQIEDYLQIAMREPEVSTDPSSRALNTTPVENEHQVLLRWANLFREEIDAVQRARNSVAHAYEISDDNLQQALEVGRRLLHLADSKLVSGSYRRKDDPSRIDWEALKSWLKTRPTRGYPFRVGDDELRDLQNDLTSPDDIRLARVLLRLLRNDLQAVEDAAAAVPYTNPAHYRKSSSLRTRIRTVEEALTQRGFPSDA
jgi:hypothetical protein